MFDHSFDFCIIYGNYTGLYLKNIQELGMPKMKTKRSAAKRFSKTATGKIKCKKAGLRHILTNKSRGLKRGKRATGYVDSTCVKQLSKCIPYA